MLNSAKFGRFWAIFAAVSPQYSAIGGKIVRSGYYLPHFLGALKICRDICARDGLRLAADNFAQSGIFCCRMAAAGGRVGALMPKNRSHP